MAGRPYDEERDFTAVARIWREVGWIDDTEAQVRALLDHVGLEYEPACLDFHRTERAVRTPSSEQVRQPIYRSAADEWRRYEAHLEPLRAALGPLFDAPAA